MASPLDVASVLPLTPSQQGLLLHSIADADRGVYLNQMVMTVTGELDPGLLRRCWERTVRRHDALRTAFLWEDFEQPVQAVRRDVRLPWTERDWSELPATERDRMLAEHLARDRATPFILTRAPLLRLLLVRVDARTWWLVWTYHHLLVDGWAMSLVLEEVFIRYRAAGSRVEPELAAALSYSEYVTWLYDQDTAAAERFWRRRLASFAGPTPLPGARSAPDGDPDFGEIMVELSEAELSELREFCRRHRLTLGTVVHGAWALLLSRYSVRREVMFGSVVSGRPPELPGVDAMVGLLSNTLPVSATVDDDADVVGWLAALQVDLAEARQYEYSSLSKVAQWAGAAGAANLFGSIVAWENYPVQSSWSTRDDGIGVTGIRGHERPHYPITLVASAEHRLGLRLHVDLRWYDLPVATRLAEQLRCLLVDLAADRRQRLGELSMMPADERTGLVGRRAAGGPGEPLGATVSAAFDAALARTPDAPAIVHGDEELTYREFAARGNRLAWYLRGLGVGPEVPVAVCLSRSVRLLVALYGVIRAGGVIVPIDARSPKARIATLLSISGSRMVLTAGDVHAALPARADLLVVTLDDEAVLAEVNAGRDELPAPAQGPDSGLYIVHRSAATGARRGVVVTHRGVLNQLGWLQRSHAIGPGDRVAQVTPVGVDVPAWEVFWPLLTGACVLVPDGGRGDLERLAAELPHPAASMTGYGPAETSGVCVAWTPAAGDEPRRDMVGAPIDNVRCYLLDSALRPVPDGVPGELYLAGAGLARGYCGQPGATADQFVPDPVSLGGGRAYRTGDLARLLPGGELEYLGRTGAFPLAGNGQVRGTGMPPAGPDLEPAPPTTDTERLLAEIWAEVIGVDRVGVHDNFFELGGDSIMSLLVVSRAAHAGLRITPRQFLDRQTVAGLAEVAEHAAAPVRVGPPPTEDRVREIALTPIQHWFFGHEFAHPRHWNLGVSLAVTPDQDASRDPGLLAERLRPVFAEMIARHDALRTRFRRDPSRGWVAEVVPAAELATDDAVSLVSVRDRPDWERALGEVAYAAQEFDLGMAPLLRAVLVDGGRDDRLRLLLIAHHLVMDGVSLRVLLEDLRIGHRQAASGQPVRLPAASTSNAAWADALVALARRPDIVADVDFWRAQQAVAGGLPADVPDAPARAAEAGVRHVHVSLTADETRRLLREVPRAYHTQVDDVLLTALGRAVAGRTGQRAAVVALESHGREQDLVTGADLSGTVGWLTAIAPVRLALSTPDEEPGRSLTAMKEQLRGIPRRGLSYGLLRYLNPEFGPELAALAQPTICFNNLGQLDAAIDPTAGVRPAASGLVLRPAPEKNLLAHHPDNHRPHLLDITCVTEGGRLRLTFSYSPAHHEPRTVRGLAADIISQLRLLIAHCCGLDRTGYTPSDFPESGLDQRQLDLLVADVHS